MSYKSVRLLVEAIHAEMNKIRFHLISSEPSTNNDAAQDGMIELRKLIEELESKASRPTIDDVTKQSPGDYVATMKPLVRKYHQQLMVADKLAPCLCEDLQAGGCILMLIGDDKTIVRTAADPNRPEVQLAVEALLASMDRGTKEVVTDGAAEVEKQLGLAPPPEAEEPEKPLRVRYLDRIQQDDFERNAKAEFVIDENDIIVKDRLGDRYGQKATQEEIDSCIVVKDPTTGVGMDEP